MKKWMYFSLILFLFIPYILHASADKDKFLHWKFENTANRNVIESVSGANDTIEGNFSLTRGIVDKAIKLDGFTTAIRHRAKKEERLSGSFAIETWVALAAYPWNWCPVITRMNPNKGGFSMEVGPRGEFGLKMNIAGNFVKCISDANIPLREWVHLAAVYEEGTGLKIYLNGEPAGTYKTRGKPRFASSEEVRIGMNYEAVKPSDQIGDAGNKPYWYSLDGKLDELKVYNHAPGDSHFKNAYAQKNPIPGSGLERRVMPRGPEAPLKFNAYYTRLKYYEEWDNLWPVDSDPDIVVTFENSPVRVIFWRGTRYSPAWVTDKDQWMCDQSVEAWNGTEGCFEHMQDRHCRYSHVRIIENTEARKVIHWRYAPVSAYNNLWRENEKTGWAVWVDEYYYIYPDATAIRKVSWNTGALGYPRQFQESLPLTNPEQTQGDVLEADYLTIANLEGETQHYEYLEDMSNAAEKQEPESPNIQQHNFKSPYDPFIIFEPGNKMKYISDRNISSFQHPGTCNHWPVGQAYCDGRITQAADRPTHFLGFPISTPVINQDGQRSYINSVYGMKDTQINQLVEVGKSWARSPELNISGSRGFSGGEYDMSQKAYVINRTSNHRAELKFNLDASENSPAVNPAFVINKWGDHDFTLVVNGKEMTEGKDYQTGYVQKFEGTRVIIWLKQESHQPMNIKIEESI